MGVVVLPFLVELPHVNQPILHLLQTPDLLPSTPTANLDGWFTEHCVPLPTHTETVTQSTLVQSVCVHEHVWRLTLRLAFRLSDGICRVTLYSVCRSSSSEIKLASCTKRFARTICSLKRRRLLTSTTSLTEPRGKRRRLQGGVS